LKTHTIPRIPMEGFMVLKKLYRTKDLGFLLSAADFKKYVFIKLRKQIGQKMEGISASYF